MRTRPGRVVRSSSSRVPTGSERRCIRPRCARLRVANHSRRRRSERTSGRGSQLCWATSGQHSGAQKGWGRVVSASPTPVCRIRVEAPGAKPNDSNLRPTVQEFLRIRFKIPTFLCGSLQLVRTILVVRQTVLTFVRDGVNQQRPLACVPFSLLLRSAQWNVLLSVSSDESEAPGEASTWHWLVELAYHHELGGA